MAPGGHQHRMKAAKNLPEDVCPPCATPHNVWSPVWKGEEDASSSTSSKIPSLLAKSFRESCSAPGQRQQAQKCRTEQGVMVKRAPCGPSSNRH